MSEREMLLQRAEQWLALELEPDNRSRIQQLIEEAKRSNDDLLRERFQGRLHFGTAGLRGEIGAGPQRMNRALIRWVSVGLSRYLLRSAGQSPQRVVIGYDGRHKSLTFAQEAASCFSAHGFAVEVATTVCPTPLLAYAVCQREAIAGVMVTASHNPPKDNGFKVYWGNGAQIIPPQDIEISEEIDRVSWEELVGESLSVTADRSLGEIKALDLTPQGEIGQGYQAALEAQLFPRSTTSFTPLRVIYTAMHGVGAEWFIAMLDDHPDVELIPVEEQRDPDPDFPTVSFPNPEEPGALDLASSYAARYNAPLILAHDPDADRLAVVARDSTGQLKAFTGDQVGALIAHEMFTRRELNSNDLVATTIVSSSLLENMAKRVGVSYAETLTGFKWIANRALVHQAEGGRFLFGYEEAIGYSLFGLVNDKDGLSAGRFLIEMALHARQDGITLWDRLAEIYRLDGLYLSSLVSRVRRGVEGAQEIAQSMSHIRAHPPIEVGEIKVKKVTDLLQSPAPLTGNVLRFDLADGSRVIMRPSGTEPKLKLYFETRVEVGIDDDLVQQQLKGEARLQALSKAFTRILDSDLSS